MVSERYARLEGFLSRKRDEKGEAMHAVSCHHLSGVQLRSPQRAARVAARSAQRGFHCSTFPGAAGLGRSFPQPRAFTRAGAAPLRRDLPWDQVRGRRGDVTLPEAGLRLPLPRSPRRGKRRRLRTCARCGRARPVGESAGP